MEDRKKKRKIFTVIINVISYILLLILAVYVVMHFIFPRHVIKIFRFQHITVLTDSMEPVINVDDVIIIKNFNPDRLKKGDIITFYVDFNNDGKKEMVTHYFYESVLGDDGKTLYRTISNVSTTPDEWEIGAEDIVGKYVGRIPGVGKIIRFFRHPIGILALAINIFLIYLIYRLIKGKEQTI